MRLLNRKSQNLMMSVFCSKTIIVTPECWKSILRGPDFKIFLGGGGLSQDPPKNSRLRHLQVAPTKNRTENPG